MNLRKLFYATMAATGLSAMTATAAPVVNVASSFDNNALAARLGASCTTQERQRAQRVRGGMAFVIESRHFDAQMRADANALFAKIPKHTKALAFNEGGAFVWPRYGLAEAIPSRKNSRNGYITPGLYLEGERRLYLPFMIADNVTRNPDHFFEMPARRERLMNHEGGHMIDDLIGNYSYASRSRGADGRLTDRRDYKDAIVRDQALIREKRRNVKPVSRYMPVSLGGDPDNTEQLVRREVFAELWAESSGYLSTGLSRYYPETFKVVKGIYDHLQTLHQTKGMPCTYEKNGRATAVPRA